MESNLRHYSRRAAEERAAANRAVTAAARDRHLTLALRFAAKAAAEQTASAA